MGAAIPIILQETKMKELIELEFGERVHNFFFLKFISANEPSNLFVFRLTEAHIL